MIDKMKTAKSSVLALCAVILISSLAFMPTFFIVPKTKKSLDSKIRVACVGDSITESSGYPENLQVILGTDYLVRNFGVSGSTVLLSSDRPYANQPQYQYSQSFQPSIVVIMLGTNDARANLYQTISNFSADYKKLICEYQTLDNSPAIWLVTPPPILENELDLKDVQLQHAIIPQIEQVANELDLPTIDVNSPLTSYPEYFGDGVHPSIEAAMLIATAISDAIIFNNTKAV